MPESSLLSDNDDKHSKREQQIKRGMVVFVGGVLICVLLMGLWFHASGSQNNGGGGGGGTFPLDKRLNLRNKVYSHKHFDHLLTGEMQQKMARAKVAGGDLTLSNHVHQQQGQFGKHRSHILEKYQEHMHEMLGDKIQVRDGIKERMRERFEANRKHHSPEK